MQPSLLIWNVDLDVTEKRALLLVRFAELIHYLFAILVIYCFFDEGFYALLQLTRNDGQICLRENYF